ncbi:sensor histidine kinase [Sanguibacter sp. A247]|uniref:sensor histidine kinase n=1 Tax=unclassified Sanguibacter TaxID=2645534 RepID=UPI003FD7B093
MNPDGAAAVRADVGRADVVRAVICWAVAAAALVAAPAFAGVDPAVGEAVAALGSVPWWVAFAAITSQAVPVACARVAPRTALATVALGPFVGAVVGDAGLTGIASLATAVTVYVALVRTSGAAAPATALAGVLTAAAHAITGLRDDTLTPFGAVAGALGQGVIVVGGAALVAAFVAARRLAQRAREHELRAHARERDASVREARAQERIAMARELHDIAAHHLSGIAVMAAAIERQVTRDPSAAEQGAREVRGQSKAVLRDLRRLVGLLREGADGEMDVESLAGVATLVERANALGTTVDLTVQAGAEPFGAGLGPLAQLTAFRMVQESLANAARHAPGAPTHVSIDDRSPREVVVVVRNAAAVPAPGAGDGTGLGLVGMRERAELTGARLAHGPTVDGGWDVTLTLPRDADQAEEDPR